MDTIGQLIDGFTIAIQPENLLVAAIGVTVGTLVGVLPGISPSLTIALLLPITTQVSPGSAFIMFAGILYGSMYGASTTSILLNTPGESASVITALEGNAMARRGRGAAALATAAIGSFVAGTIGTLGITFLAPVMVRVALTFGPWEYFALIVFAFVMISAVLGKSALRGIASLGLGTLLATVGIDRQSAQPRLTLGIPELADGISVIVVAVGLFAVGETLFAASRMRRDVKIESVVGSVWMTGVEWARSWPAWLRGTLLGFPLGSLPAGGAETPTMLSYAVERRISKHPEEFGKGAIEGVAGPEAANNASVAGSLVPLLTLGLPTSATTAMMLVAFQQYGLQPGPLLFRNSADLVWGLIASLYIGNVLLLLLNLPLVGLWVKLLSIPRHLLYGGILVLATVGAYSLDRSLTDVILVYVIGAVGFLMRQFGFPLAPAVVGVVLSPLLELQFRRAQEIAAGDFTTFVTRPISGAILGATALLVVGSIVLRVYRRASLPSSEEI